MSERISDTFRMPDSYYEQPDDPECPDCDQPFDGEKCECGFEAPDEYDVPSGHDTHEEARGER